MKASNVGAQLKISLTVIIVPVAALKMIPRVVAKPFQVESMSRIKSMKMTGPLTGPNGITKYVYFVQFGPANASFSRDDAATLI